MGPLQLKWVEALESEKYKQGKHYLRDGDKYCCLGVACEVLGIKPYFDGGRYLFDGFRSIIRDFDKLGLFSEGGMLKVPHEEIQTLVGMNDNGWTFKEIAAYIREHEDNVFERSV